MSGKHCQKVWYATFPPAKSKNSWLSVQKLASVCSVAQQELDKNLYSRLLLLLSDESPIFDNLVHEAALKAFTVLVRKYVTL